MEGIVINLGDELHLNIDGVSQKYIAVTVFRPYWNTIEITLKEITMTDTPSIIRIEKQETK